MFLWCRLAGYGPKTIMGQVVEFLLLGPRFLSDPYEKTYLSFYSKKQHVSKQFPSYLSRIIELGKSTWRYSSS